MASALARSVYFEAMKLIFLYGLPGTGKLTIARELSQLTGYKLFHNHLTVDLLLSVFEFGSNPFVELREKIWLSVFEEAASLPAMIFTFNPENSVRQSFIEKSIQTAESRGGEVLFIEVVCDPAELERRLDTQDRRQHKKLVSVEHYRKLKADGVFDSPKMPLPKLTLNSTQTSPRENAKEIAARFSLPIAARGSSASCYTSLLMARQRLGQHFLADENWQESIAREIGVSRNSQNFFAPGAEKDFCWIEIGAGHGEMTRHLLAAGKPVIAVELDPPLAKRLGKLIHQFPNLTVYHGDVLKSDLRALAAGRRIKIYGNLPYYITSPILHRFFAVADLMDEIHIVIQQEVAFRLAAKPGTRDYGYLSVLTQYFSWPTVALKIPREAFSPPPEVGSALVSLKLPGQKAELRIADEDKFLDFVKSCFAQKRKTLVNNLRKISKQDATRNALSALGLSPEARAEELSVSSFASLFGKISN